MIEIDVSLDRVLFIVSIHITSISILIRGFQTLRNELYTYSLMGYGGIEVSGCIWESGIEYDWVDDNRS